MQSQEFQKHCEALEELLEYECHTSRLKHKEFDTINQLLFELQVLGLYKLPDKYNGIL